MKKSIMIGLAGMAVVAALTIGFLLGQRGRGAAMPQPDQEKQEGRKNGRPEEVEEKRRRTPPKPIKAIAVAKPSAGEGDPKEPQDMADMSADGQTREGGGRTPARSDIRDFVMEEYARLSKADGAVDAQFLEQIRSCGDRDVLATLTDMIRNGLPEEKMGALFALAAAFGRGNSTDGDGLNQVVDASQAGQGNPGEASEEEARRIHDVVEATGAGLSAAEETVRQAAYETMRMLGNEEQGILTAQILSGEDATLKRRLIADTSGSANERDVMTSISALENPDAETARAAAANLNNVLGQKFSTQDEALSWWEKNHETFRSQH